MKSNSERSELTSALLALSPYLWRAFGFSVIGALLVLAPTWYMLEVYERVVNSRSYMTLAMLTLLVVWVYTIMEVLDWARSQTLLAASLQLDRVLAGRVFQATYEGGLARSIGSTLQPMNDFRTLRDFVSHPVVGAVMEAPVSLVFLLILFVIHPMLGWAALVGGLLQLLIGWFNQRSTTAPLMAASRASIAAQRQADGSLRNSEAIESMGMLPDLHRRWLKLQRQFLSHQAVASDRAGAFQAAGKFLQVTQSSLLLGLGAWLMLAGVLPGAGGLMIVGSVLGARMLAPLAQLIMQWRSVVHAVDAAGRLDEMLRTHPASEPGMPLPAPKGRLSVEQLVAGPPGVAGPPVLRGLSFALEPGEVLAVIGPSAAGKSTLARLLMGLWPASSGKVRLDGADVFNWNKLELGPHVGYLPQGVELFDGTVAENIARFGDPDPDKLVAAARAVGLHEFLESLPEGYQTMIGTDGALLSGGQRQRVALARALYGDPVFVVLDEPNSSLDQEGDAALAEAIRTLKARGTTFVVMTHRSNLLELSDQILVLRDGTQQAFGPSASVLAALQNGGRPALPPAPLQAVPRPPAPAL
ncbi:MAG: type I secretion system permease/ATPase [Burkholderiaceae bacterium]